MKYDWENQSTEEPPEQTTDEISTDGLLPNFCKKLGVVIAIIPILYKAISLIWASAFIHLKGITDLVLFGVILGGLLIEMNSRSKIETRETVAFRIIGVRVIIVIAIIYFWRPLMDNVF